MKNLAEREIIKMFAREFDHKSALPLGFDDDVSAIPLTTRLWLVLKTDMLVASTDVPPGMTAFETGRKAVVSTVSDFAAKGVQPRALMVSIGMPRPARAKMVKEISRGLDNTAREYNCRIIGGDTNQSEDLVIDVAGIGTANPNRIIRRNGAHPGDIVAVTGSFGRPAAGLKILTSEGKIDSSKYHSLVRAARRPQARLTAGIALARTGGVTSSIDSSDGLALSLHQIAKASNVGMSLDTVPISPEVRIFAKQFRLSAVDLAMYGGEEYELVITIIPERFHTLKKHVRSLLKIGIVKPANHGLTASVGGKLREIEERGWEHFK